MTETRNTAGNTGLAKVAVQCSADTFVVKIATFAKPENVTGHAKRQCNNKTTEKMNKQANASAKSKELQSIAQADTVAAHLLLPNHTKNKINNY